MTPQKAEPTGRTDREKDLLGFADLEIFSALVHEPRPCAAEPLQEAASLAEKAADDDGSNATNSRLIVDAVKPAHFEPSSSRNLTIINSTPNALRVT
jgi:hypothetical protein